MKWQVWGLVILLVGGFSGWWYWVDSNRPGEKIPTLGRTHIPSRSPKPKYNSNPPTSGPHSGEAKWGVHQQEVSEINQVHNLEHGGIMIQYNCDALSQDNSCGKLKTELRAIYKKAREEDKKIILAPYSDMDRLIALTSWTRLQYFDEVDEPGMIKFITANLNNAPEQVNN